MHCIAAGTTIAIQGNRWRPQAAKQEGNEVSITFPWSTWKERLERPNVRGFSIDSTSRNGAPFRKGGVAIDGETTEQATNEYLPPLPPQNSPLLPTHTHYFSYSRAHLPHRRARGSIRSTHVGYSLLFSHASACPVAPIIRYCTRPHMVYATRLAARLWSQRFRCSHLLYPRDGQSARVRPLQPSLNHAKAVKVVPRDAPCDRVR